MGRAGHRAQANRAVPDETSEGLQGGDSAPLLCGSESLDSAREEDGTYAGELGQRKVPGRETFEQWTRTTVRPAPGGRVHWRG